MNTMKAYEVVVDGYGNIRWFNEQGQYHCEHGPAVEYVNGGKCWYQNDKLHRLDGPAVEDADGIKHWYIKGKKYSETEFKKKVKELKNPKPSCNGKIITIEGKQYKLQELN